jgi:hypothetical protein
MNKIVTVASAIAFLLGGDAFAADTTTVVYNFFSPTGAGKSVQINTGAKSYKYFIAEKGSSFGFDVTGPTKVKILTRAEFKTGQNELSYEIQTWEGDHLIKGRKVKTTPAAFLFNNANLGLGRGIILDVPAGKHSYRLWITSDLADTYYLRFYQTQSGAGIISDYIQPTQFQRQVTYLSGNTILPYYLVDSTGGVTLDLAGPMRLTIFCRANYDHDMTGKAKFMLGMFEEGREAAQFAGVVKMATGAQFKELTELVPSTLTTFTFTVPAGRHVYQFKKLESASPSLALRFKIAKPILE